MSQRSGRKSSVHSGRPNSNPPLRKVRPQPPQKTIEDFWSAFTTKYPGKVFNILPKNVYAKHKADREPKGTVYGQHALKSYEEARAECIAAVQQISRECRRVNMRYRDPHFDIEFDLKTRSRRCLDGIGGFDASNSPRPRAVKRVPEIFKKPSFYVDGTAAADVRQGKTGDCYFLAAVGALGNKQGLIDRVCVDHDEEVGVYGFVFHRDGEWMHTVIDDKLYLSIPDYDESRAEKSNWSEIINRADAESEYKEAFQTGSRALYFAQCNDENETWLPLLEKAYAKSHGDYYSIIGGFTGEAIEDLTGGVTTELFGSDILNKDQFWNDELKHVGKKFLFGCATGRFDDWQDGTSTAWRQGIVSTHAYTILRADTYQGERLLLVRNPWGQAEWSGRWSDGSEQWTAESIQALGHKFGDDGMFWISFEDLLRKYQFFDRTRLFDDGWKVTQQWTSVDVRWTADYNETKFTLILTERSPLVIVLSQLDQRYFMGLEGQYSFTLHFRVDKEGADTYEVRSHGNYWMSRSVSTEVTLDAGTYNVFIKVKADRDPTAPRVEDVVRRNCKQNQEKLLQVGLAYDLAHAKGVVAETEESKRQAAEAKQRVKAKAKKEAIKKARADKYRKWQVETREIERSRREKARLEEHKKKKKAKEAAVLAKKRGEAPEHPATDTAVAEATPATETAHLESAPPDDAKATAPPQSTEASAELSAKASSDAGVVSIPSSIHPSAEADASKPTQGPDESEWVVEGKPQESAAAKIDAAIREPLRTDKSLAVPDMKVTDPNSTVGVPPPSPPASPGASPSSGERAPSEAGSARTIVTFNSSIDSLLDLPSYQSEVGSAAATDSDDEDEAVDSDNDEFANDPWNAVCVVGLRVYSQKGDVSVAVVRPKTTDDDDDTPLDVDDPSKAVSDEVPSRMGSQILPPKGKATASASQVPSPGLEQIGEKEAAS